MKSDKKEVMTFENLVSDVLVLILLYTGDPIYFGRLMQVSKRLRDKFINPTKSKVLWDFFLQSDFPKFQISQDTDCQKSYRELSANKTEQAKLNIKHRRLINLIKIGDLTSIRNGKNLPDMSNEKFLYEKSSHLNGAILVATRFNRQEILNFIYKLLCVNVFSKRDRDVNGRTQLHWAAACNILSAVEELSKNAKIINSTDKWKYSPLSLAATYGNRRVVAALILAGADDRVVFTGATPLHVAAEMGHDEVVSDLLAAGYDVHRTTDAGAGPLLIAAQFGRLKTVKVLLAAGGNPNSVTPKGDAALYVATDRGHHEVVNELVAAGCDVNVASNNGWTAFHVAAQNGHVGVVSILIRQGFPVDRIILGRRTALDIAVQFGHLNVVIELLSAGAEINRTFGDNFTALYLAALKGRAEIVKVLLKAGADANLASKGVTPLQAAANGVSSFNLNMTDSECEGHQATYSILKLWQVYQQQKNQSLYQQLATILKAQTSLSLISAVTSYFSTSAEDRQCQEIIKELANLASGCKDGGEKSAFRDFLKSKQGVIPADKYEFIMELAFATPEDKSPVLLINQLPSP